MSSHRRKGAVLALALALVAAVAALAVAAGKGPKTDATQATFTAQQTSSKPRTCTGQDGTYADTRDQFTGATTGDPRLSGKLVVKTHTLVNQDTGLGTSRGTVRILDPDTGQLKAGGKFQAVVTNGSVLNGFLAGHVHDHSGDAPHRAGRLWANFRAEGDQSGAVTGELGGGASENSAVIQTGGCGKPQNSHQQHTAKPKKPKPHPKQS